jgi:sec-independent protein translocase protein TatA
MNYVPGLGMLGTQELMIVLVLFLLLFGAKRLPQLAKGLGSSMREFKRGAAGLEDVASLGKTKSQLD